MRDITVLHNRFQFRRFFRHTFRTDLFVDSLLDPHGYVRSWVDQISRWPLVVYEMDDERVEKNHFTPWFGAIGKREYDNDAIHDLFWLHEVVHMAKMWYNPEDTFQRWSIKIKQNEVSTSLETEAMVYQELPGLRGLSFDREIWADRFLQSGRIMTRRLLSRERRRAMQEPRDEIERRISQFADENDRWCEIWRPWWAEVEDEMRRFRSAARHHPVSAARTHVSWLRAPENGYTDETPYPFPEAAQQWANVYWSSREGVGY